MTVSSLTPFAAAAPTASLSSTGAVLRVLLALAVVLAAVFVSAWMSRRVRGIGNAGGRSLEVLAQLALGPRERAVLLRVGERQLLLGVTPGSVRTLHVLEHAPQAEPDAAPAAAEAQRPSFRALLLRSLGK